MPLWYLQTLLAAISLRISYFRGDDNNDDVCFIPYQNALLYFYSANSLKQRSVGRYVVLP